MVSTGKKGIYSNLLSSTGQIEKLDADSKKWLQQTDELRGKGDLTIGKKDSILDNY